MARPATSGNNSAPRSNPQQTLQEARAPNATTLQPGDEFSETQLARSRSRYRRAAAQSDQHATQQTTRPATQPVTSPKVKEQIDVVQRWQSQSKREFQLAPIVQPNLGRKPSARRYRDSTARGLNSPRLDEGTPSPLSEIDREEVEAKRPQALLERDAVTRDSPPVPQDTPPLEQRQPPRQGPFLPPQVEPARPQTSHDIPPKQLRATKSTSALPSNVHPNDSYYKEEADAGCFNLFKRRKIEQVPYLKEQPPILHHKKSRETMMNKAGGGAAVAGVDAPISAVNAGDREVLVQCGKSKATFPVTPSTTPVDILKSASKCMPERIDVKSAVLLEHFVTVGVQRPLRRYEHIRDVMNSWDNDRQNSLILVDPGTGSSEAELSIAGVPAEKPDDISWVLDFSQRVGKWDKRVITLRSDGQITMQKDSSKPQEQTNLCHLSDFDIYRPTQEKIRKKIKPPKKFCFAIKSQQKTAMFESTHDFVHFFCTNYRPTADTFYDAVQGWRSWYLVNVMGEGRKVRQAPDTLERPLMDLRIDEEPRKTDVQRRPSRAEHESTAFKPMLNVTRVEVPATPTTPTRELQPPAPASGFTKSSSQFDTTISPERRTSTARRQPHPPGSMRNRAHLAEDEPLANLGRNGSVTRRSHSSDRKRSLDRKVSLDRKESLDRKPSLDHNTSPPEEFAETGLLGRNYSQRKKEYEERERKAKNPSTTVLGQGLQHSTSRTKSSQMPEPLVDLTPINTELPHHSKKGKAFIPEKVGEGGLVENATSPEDPLGLPTNADWRAGRNTSLTRNTSTTRSTRRPDREAPTGFTGEGLLAGSQAARGWGELRTGRGVMDGSRAKGPMLDMGGESLFANGSLMAKMESAEGPVVPVIDRSRVED